MFLKNLSADDAPLMASALVGACRIGPDWALEVQPQLLAAVFRALLGFEADFHTLEPATPEQIARALTTTGQRQDIIDLMLTVELVCHPIPAPLTESIDRWALALGVENAELQVSREIAQGASAQAQFDLYRLGYWGTSVSQDEHFQMLFERYGMKAYVLTVEPDAVEAARWAALEQYSSDSLGRAIWTFYTERGFSFPGMIGGANKILAHHDWVHVLADYSTTGLGEVEVGAFRATNTEFPGSTLAFIAGQLGFWQGGMIESALTGRHQDHVLEVPGAPQRVADALRRGRECTRDLFVDLDFFDYADQSLAQLRQRWNIVPKAVDESPDHSLQA